MLYSPLDNTDLIDFFQDLGILQNHNNLPNFNTMEGTNENINILSKPITTAEIKNAISKSKNNKAARLDCIPYEILKEMPARFHIWLAKFYNEVVKSGLIPEQWSEYKVSIIPKTGSRSFRPISISCTLLKILERILCDRMNWYVESEGIIPSNLYGFRYGKSCNDCFSLLRTELDKSKVEGKFFGIIFADIKGAFNHVNVEMLLNILLNVGIPPKIVILLSKILLNRNLHGFASGIELGEVRTNTGVPQGSVLSPLLFNLYIYKLNEWFSHGVKAIGFADDICFYVSHKDLTRTTNILQENLINFKNKLQDLDLDLAISKTQLLLYPPNYGFIPENTVTIELEGNVIVNLRTAKYLGAVWDHKLHWEQHINKLWLKGTNLLKLLRAISSHSWGCHPSTLLVIFKGLIRPSTEWGQILFDQAANKLLNKLQVIQNEALRLVTGCFRTTPLNVLHHLAGVETLVVRREFSLNKYVCKSISDVGNNPVLNNFKDLQRCGNKIAKSKVFSLYKVWVQQNQNLKQLLTTNKNCTFDLSYEGFYVDDCIDTSCGKILKDQKYVQKNLG